MTPARHDGAHRPVALVTGAARRVGRAIAIALADAGFDLVLHAHRSEETLAELCAELAHSCTVRQVTADLRQAEGQDALSREVLDTTPRLDAVVHNAADYRRQPLCDLTRHDLTRMMALNLEAPLFVTRALLPALRRAPDPCVVHLGDSAADLPYPAHAPYLVSKAALHALTRALAVELAPHVRVNAVAPGTVAFSDDFSRAKRRSIARAVPLGRTGTPDDVARAVRYLVLEAPFVTGQILAVDGGRSIAP